MPFTPKDDAVPVGSMPVNPAFDEPSQADMTGQLPGDSVDGTNPDDTWTPPADGVPADGVTPPDAAPGGDKSGTKSDDDIRKMLEDSQRFIGQQSTQIGELRKELESLKSASQPQQQQQQGQPDPDALLRETLSKYEAGEATVEETIVAAFSAGKQASESIVDQKLAQRDQEAHAKQLQDSYLQQNPDFMQLHESGVIAQEMQKNPLHTPVSAYEAIKRSESNAQIAELQKQIDAMKAEREASIAAGRTNAGKTITTPGSTMRSQQGAAPSSASIRDSMIAAVNQVRNANA